MLSGSCMALINQGISGNNAILRINEGLSTNNNTLGGNVVVFHIKIILDGFKHSVDQFLLLLCY